MKKKYFTCTITLFILLFSFASDSCKKVDTEIFCENQRKEYSTFVNKEGIVVYSNKYNRYAISFPINNPNNIDSQVIGFVCNLKPEFRKVGLSVIVSGTLLFFNNNENMTPEIAGQDIYFLKISQLVKN